MEEIGGSNPPRSILESSSIGLVQNGARAAADLLEDEDTRRWYETLKRGSEQTADVNACHRMPVAGGVSWHGIVYSW